MLIQFFFCNIFHFFPPLIIISNLFFLILLNLFKIFLLCYLLCYNFLSIFRRRDDFVQFTVLLYFKVNLFSMHTTYVSLNQKRQISITKSFSNNCISFPRTLLCSRSTHTTHPSLLTGVDIRLRRLGMACIDLALSGVKLCIARRNSYVYIVCKPTPVRLTSDIY